MTQPELSASVPLALSSTLSWRAEHACLNAWPALSNVFHDGWGARFADGLTRRANSVNPLHGGATMDGPSLQFFENLFRGHDLPLIIRMPWLLDPVVDRGLDQLGYQAEGEVVRSMARSAHCWRSRIRRREFRARPMKPGCR